MLKLQAIVMDPNAEIKIEAKLEKDATLADNLGIEAAQQALNSGAKEIIDKLPKENVFTKMDQKGQIWITKSLAKAESLCPKFRS